MSVSAVGQVAEVTGKIFDAVRVREERNNTAEMRANAEAEQRQILRESILKAVAAGDLDAIRQLAAEV
jgi:hypothetical protein